MSNIFNISEKYLSLMREIENAEGVLDEELAARLQISEDELEAKLKAYAYLIKIRQGENKVIDDEIERLSNLKSSRENTITRLKDNILAAVQLFGYEGKTGNKKLDFDTVKFYTVNKQVLLVDEEQFDDSGYFKYTVKNLNAEEFNKVDDVVLNPDYTKTIDRIRLLADIKDGAEVEHSQSIIKPYIVIK